jgi:hypothetical protein
MRSSSCRLSGISWKRWSGSKSQSANIEKKSRFGNEAAFLLQNAERGLGLDFLEGAPHR